MEWMRCNSCWLKVSSGESVFHLTQCGHVFCDKCVAKAESRCCQCGSEGAISLPLTQPMNQQIAHYFTPRGDLLDKLFQADQFQQAQMDLVLKRMNENESKYQTLKEAYWACAENLKKVYQKYNKLKNEIQKRKEKLNAPVSIFTPAQHYTPPLRQYNASNHQQSFSQNHSVQGYLRTQSTPEYVFRLPASTKVPKSATSGYYSASSSFNSSRQGLSVSSSRTTKNF